MKTYLLRIAMIKNILKSAFTLIEMVITIAVIGILSAALISVYADLSGSAGTAVAKATLSALQSQIAIHFAAHQSLPTMQNLQEEMGGSTSASLVIVKNSNIFQILDSNGNPVQAQNAQGHLVPIKIYAYQDPVCSIPVVQLSPACGGIAMNEPSKFFHSSKVLGYSNDLVKNSFFIHALLLSSLLATASQATDMIFDDTPESGTDYNLKLGNLNVDPPAPTNQLGSIALPGLATNSNTVTPTTDLNTSPLTVASNCTYEISHTVVACVDLK